MRVFTEAKARFALHLRPQEVLEAISVADSLNPVDTVEVDNALDQLCVWRNLDKHPDTSDVATLKEFYRPRFLFQLTAKGEAASRSDAPDCHPGAWGTDPPGVESIRATG